MTIFKLSQVLEKICVDCICKKFLFNLSLTCTYYSSLSDLNCNLIFNYVVCQQLWIQSSILANITLGMKWDFARRVHVINGKSLKQPPFAKKFIFNLSLIITFDLWFELYIIFRCCQLPKKLNSIWHFSKCNLRNVMILRFCQRSTEISSCPWNWFNVHFPKNTIRNGGST